jgi:hypothetical protein
VAEDHFVVDVFDTSFRTVADAVDVGRREGTAAASPW